LELFLDTANLTEIRDAAQYGVISGVTTNPSLIAQEKGRDFHEILQEITQLIPGPVSAEVLSTTAAGMYQEATKLAGIRDNIVIKIPMTREGIKCVPLLAKEGIKTNVTLVFSLNQALLAARAGATYVSPFVGRLDDVGHDGISLVREIVEVLRLHNLSTKVIAASIRHPMHVMEAARVGSHIATIPYKVFLQLFEHPMTALGLEKFQKDWEAKLK
jgi:transaldolase